MNFRPFLVAHLDGDAARVYAFRHLKRVGRRRHVGRARVIGRWSESDGDAIIAIRADGGRDRWTARAAQGHDGESLTALNPGRCRLAARWVDIDTVRRAALNVVSYPGSGTPSQCENCTENSETYVPTARSDHTSIVDAAGARARDRYLIDTATPGEGSLSARWSRDRSHYVSLKLTCGVRFRLAARCANRG